MTLALVIWAAATSAHVALTARAAKRFIARDASLDALIFTIVLATVGGLAAVLHIAAVTLGISIYSVAGLLAACHVALWIATRRLQPLSIRPAGVLEWLAIAAWVVIGVSWIDGASRSAAVFGPDAAHYHVPFAVNLANGAGLFGLPATPHLYPMAGSVVAAWFFLATGNTLLVDLAMLLPFALVVASLNLLFRSVTGKSGLACCSWLSLLLFSTPMFRSSAMGAADLWFAAGFLAVLATMAAKWAAAPHSSDLLLIGLASGVLLGSKSAGAPSLLLLVATFVVINLAARVTRGRTISWTGARRSAAALGLTFAVGAGGIWLIRNWLQYGSPVAPAGISFGGLTLFPGETFTGTTYYSVLGEMESERFRLTERVMFFVGQWYGWWFLPSLFLIPIVLVDVIATAVRGGGDRHAWARTALLIQTIVCGGVLSWWLVGAPWSALDRSGGFTLRYLLPIAALLPLVAYVTFFPLAPYWNRSKGLLKAAAGVIGLWSVWAFWQSTAQGPVSSQGLPTVSTGGLLVGSAAVVVLSLLPRKTSTLKNAVRLLVFGIGGLVFVLLCGGRSQASLAAARSELWQQEQAYAQGQRPASGWREVFLAVLSAERAAGQVCESRRFMSIVRDDEPLALQPPEVSSRVFYAGRDVASAGRAPMSGRCDYVVTTVQLEETDKGKALVAALGGGRPVQRTAIVGHFMVYRGAER